MFIYDLSLDELILCLFVLILSVNIFYVIFELFKSKILKLIYSYWCVNFIYKWSMSHECKNKYIGSRMQE